MENEWDETDEIAPKSSKILEVDKGGKKETYQALPPASGQADNHNSRQMTMKDWLKIVIMPIILLILTAISINVIGIQLQDRSFRKNEVFKARIDSIETARQETISIQKDFERARRQIRQNENDIRTELENTQNTSPEELSEDRKHYCNGESMQSSLGILRETLVRGNALLEYTTETIDVKKAVSDFNTKLLTYIACVDNTECRRCNDKDKDLGQDVIDSITKIITAEIQARDDLIKKYD